MKKHIIFIIAFLSSFVFCEETKPSNKIKYGIGHAIDLSAGWENMGISPTTTWKPYYGLQHTQGSRKAMTIGINYHVLGTTRVYYSPTIGLDYGAVWSESGAMNTMQLNLGMAGIGIFLTKPPNAYEDGNLKGKTFITFDIDFGKFSFGGNMTPKSGIFGKHSKEWTDPNNQLLEKPNGKYPTQYYPFGQKYTFFKYSIPITFRFWGMVSNKVGLGMSFSTDMFRFEKSLLSKDISYAKSKDFPWTQGYTVNAGFLVVAY